MTGGRGKKRLEMSQLNMSQLGLKGGRVKLIETMSQNLQFFFFLKASQTNICIRVDKVLSTQRITVK